MRDPQQEAPPRHEQARTWRRYLRFFGPRAVDDLDDELRFHVEMRVREYMARGMSEAEARGATARRLGDMASARAECVTIATRLQRRATRSRYVDNFRQDIAFAMRTLGRNKAWTAVAVITLALGIGANSAMFSVVNDLLLDPLPYPHADRVALLFQAPTDAGAGQDVTVTVDANQVEAWREGARSVEAIEPYATNDVTLERGDILPEAVSTAQLLPGMMTFVGERPLIGRMFTDAEARADAPVALLSESVWRARYGADPAVIGSSVRVNGSPITIIGVMPQRFMLPRARDIHLWQPLDLSASDLGLYAVVRLARGVSRDAAQQELDTITARAGGVEASQLRFRSVLQTPAEMLSFRDSLVLLTGAVGLILLIACANVVHLLLARASSRRRELAIRSAVGAGRSRLFRQLFTESMVLSIAGGLGGIIVGWLGLRALVAARPEALAALASVRMDGTTVAATATIATLIALMFGVIGAAQAKRYSASEVLKAGALNISSGRGQGRARSLLVVTEMALCTMLLVGAGLLLRTVHHLHSQDLGFDPAGLYSVRANLPQERYPTAAARDAFHAQLAERLRVLPGVLELSGATAPPPSTNFMIGTIQREGDPLPEASSNAFNPSNNVATNYFRFMGIPIVEGTTFSDTTAAAAQVVINEALARKLWPGESAVGKRMRVAYRAGEWKTVVGVAANATTAGLTSDGGGPMTYSPLGQSAFFRPAILLRTTGEAQLAGLIAGLVQSIDPRLPPASVRSIEDAMRATAARPRFMMLLLGIFASVAVGLAAVGLYGVLAYTVALRTRDIGIRMALGATRNAVARAIFANGLAMAVVGALAGLIAARLGVRLVSHTLYGVPETDPIVFIGAPVALVTVAVLACLIPVRRAVAVDPLTAIRAE